MDQCFRLFLLLRTTKTPGHKYKTNIGRPKGGEKKADWLGASGSKEWHCGQFPWLFDLSFVFAFLPHISQSWNRRSQQSDNTNKAQTKKEKCQQRLSPSSQRTRKGEAKHDKNFEQSLYSSQVPKEKNYGPTCTHPRKA